MRGEGVGYKLGGWLGKKSKLKEGDDGVCYLMLCGVDPEEEVNGCFVIEIYSNS